MEESVFTVEFSNKRYKRLMRLLTTVTGVIMIVLLALGMFVYDDEIDFTALLSALIAPLFIGIFSIVIITIRKKKSVRLIVKSESLLLEQKNGHREDILRDNIESMHRSYSRGNELFLDIEYRTLMGHPQRVSVSYTTYENCDRLFERLREWGVKGDNAGEL